MFTTLFADIGYTYAESVTIVVICSTVGGIAVIITILHFCCFAKIMWAKKKRRMQIAPVDTSSQHSTTASAPVFLGGTSLPFDGYGVANPAFLSESSAGQQNQYSAQTAVSQQPHQTNISEGHDHRLSVVSNPLPPLQDGLSSPHTLGLDPSNEWGCRALMSSPLPPLNVANLNPNLTPPSLPPPSYSKVGAR